MNESTTSSVFSDQFPHEQEPNDQNSQIIDEHHSPQSHDSAILSYEAARDSVYYKIICMNFENMSEKEQPTHQIYSEKTTPHHSEK